MPITVECEGCAKKYRVADDKAGGVIRCKECGAKISIPDEEDEVEFQRPVKKKIGKRKKSSRGSTGLIIGLAAGGVAIVGVLVVGLVLLTGRSGQNGPAVDAAGAVPAAAPASTPAGAVPAAGSKWSVLVDAQTSKVAWPDTPPTIDGLRGGLDEILIPSTDSPMAATGFKGAQNVLRVHNLATGELIGKFSDSRPDAFSQEHALHPDGTLLASAGKLVLNQPRTVEIRDVKPGVLAKTFPITAADGHLHWLDFGPNGELLVVESGRFDGKYGMRLVMFDIAAAKEVRKFALQGNYHPNSMLLSPGRRYLVVAPGPSTPLVVYDLTQGTVAGQIPRGEFGTTGSVTGMRFSPDGTRLAALGTSNQLPAVYVFDVATGERKSKVDVLADSQQLSVRVLISKIPAVQWLPDSSGWLLSGDVVADGVSGQVLWKVETEANQFNLSNTRLRFPTPAGIWSVDGADDAGRLSLIPSPWAAARELLANRADATNLVRPGAVIALAVELGDVRFADKDAAGKALIAALEQRLQADQLKAGTEGESGLRVKYAEAQGKTLQEFKQDFSPQSKPAANPFGAATGRSVESTSAVLELSLTDAAGTTVYWTHRHAVDQTSAFMKGELTKEGVREQMFDGLLKSIASLPLPSYVTAQPDGPRLPLVHRLPRW